MRRSIGVIAAITRQIGRMRPTRGRRAADNERRNAFLTFITNAADARPTMNRPVGLKDYSCARDSLGARPLLQL